MNRTHILLALQVLVLAATVGVASTLAFRRSADPLPSVRPRAPEVTPAPVVVDAGPPPAPERAWLALEQLQDMVGPWQSRDGHLLVSLVNRDLARPRTDPDEYWVQPWRLTVEGLQGPTLVCGLYEGVQRPNPPYAVLPWRLGYCRGRAADPQGPSMATRVSVLRASGFEGLRLVLGSELDVELYQVP